MPGATLREYMSGAPPDRMRCLDIFSVETGGSQGSRLHLWALYRHGGSRAVSRSIIRASGEGSPIVEICPSQPQKKKLRSFQPAAFSTMFSGFSRADRALKRGGLPASSQGASVAVTEFCSSCLPARPPSPMPCSYLSEGLPMRARVISNYNIRPSVRYWLQAPPLVHILVMKLLLRRNILSHPIVYAISHSPVKSSPPPDVPVKNRTLRLQCGLP
ncbi:hypothetical protein BD414DRAFT_267707 [Trametes punicea]|nr:hypothetical protein BD414DRAFT_267707 [Trametes punicea]